MLGAAHVETSSLGVEGQPEPIRLTQATQQGDATPAVAAQGRSAGQGTEAWTAGNTAEQECRSHYREPPTAVRLMGQPQSTSESQSQQHGEGRGLSYACSTQPNRVGTYIQPGAALIPARTQAAEGPGHQRGLGRDIAEGLNENEGAQKLGGRLPVPYRDYRAEYTFQAGQPPHRSLQDTIERQMRDLQAGDVGMEQRGGYSLPYLHSRQPGAQDSVTAHPWGRQPDPYSHHTTCIAGTGKTSPWNDNRIGAGSGESTAGTNLETGEATPETGLVSSHQPVKGLARNHHLPSCPTMTASWSGDPSRCSSRGWQPGMNGPTKKG